MIRRYVWDGNKVVEAGRGSLKSAEWQPGTDDASPERGRRIREKALERAERREWAHLRYGDERRWAE